MPIDISFCCDRRRFPDGFREFLRAESDYGPFVEVWYPEQWDVSDESLGIRPEIINGVPTGCFEVVARKDANARGPALLAVPTVEWAKVAIKGGLGLVHTFWEHHPPEVVWGVKSWAVRRRLAGQGG